jgi:hypothetical protein
VDHPVQVLQHQQLQEVEDQVEQGQLKVEQAQLTLVVAVVEEQVILLLLVVEMGVQV